MDCLLDLGYVLQSTDFMGNTHLLLEDMLHLLGTEYKTICATIFTRYSQPLGGAILKHIMPDLLGRGSY